MADQLSAFTKSIDSTALVSLSNYGDATSNTQLHQKLPFVHVGTASKRVRQCPARLVAKASAKQQDSNRKAPLDYLREAANVSKAISASSACMPACYLCIASLQSQQRTQWI